MSTTRKAMQDYRAPSLFQPHRTREAIRDAYSGKRSRLLGYYMGLSTVPTARFIATFGFDMVWIDWEHSSCDVQLMTTMVHEIQFISEGKTTPWVRVPGHDHAAIGFALDAGASVIVPQVNTVEEAKHVCSATKYGTASNGTRSFPPYRLLSGLTDGVHNPNLTFHQNMNAQAALMIQIETLEGVKNLDAILSACHQDIDMIYLGQIDLRASMNLPGWPSDDSDEPEWLEALKLFRETCKKWKVPTGGAAFTEDREQMKKQAGEHALCMVTADVFGLVNEALRQRDMAVEVIKDLDNEEK